MIASSGSRKMSSESVPASTTDGVPSLRSSEAVTLSGPGTTSTVTVAEPTSCSPLEPVATRSYDPSVSDAVSVNCATRFAPAGSETLASQTCVAPGPSPSVCGAPEMIPLADPAT